MNAILLVKCDIGLYKIGPQGLDRVGKPLCMPPLPPLSNTRTAITFSAPNLCFWQVPRRA